IYILTEIYNCYLLYFLVWYRTRISYIFYNRLRHISTLFPYTTLFRSLAQPPRGKAVSDKVLDANPQVVIEDHVNEKATAVVVGPGLGGTVRGNDIAATAIQTAIQRNLPLLVDASGLEILDQHVFSESIPAFVLTPHTGEMHKLTQRLAPDLAEQPTVEQAAAFAQRFGVWIVLKSADTFVLSPCGLHSVHSATTSQLATAGTGDSLSGMLGAAMSTLDSTAADLPD